MSNLEQRLEADAAAWRPDQDDPPILIGEVISVDTGTSEYGPYPLLVIRDEAGNEKAVHAFHTVLRNELVRCKPQPGEKIGIKYLGDVDAKPGSPYKTYKGYKVRVERERGSAFNWNAIGEVEETGEPMSKVTYAQPTPEPVTVPADAGEDDFPF